MRIYARTPDRHRRQSSSERKLTDDVDLASVRPVLAGAEGPVRGPDAAPVRHREDVGDEEAARVRLLGADADRVALAADGDAVRVVDGEHDGVVGLDVRELLRGVAVDEVDEAVRGVGVGEEVPVAAGRDAG